MKQIVIHILAIFIAGAAVAQDSGRGPSAGKLDEYLETGMEVQGIRAPFYDKKGTRQAQLYGGHAKVLDRETAEITNLRIDVYKDNAVVMTVFAPRCLMRRAEEPAGSGNQTVVISSKGDVLIDAEALSIYGRGFRFSAEDRRFEILHDAKVIVKDGARELSEVEL